jgi:hypothetical protein
VSRRCARLADLQGPRIARSSTPHRAPALVCNGATPRATMPSAQMDRDMATMAKLETGQVAATDAKVKALLTKLLPGLEKHLGTARALPARPRRCRRPPRLVPRPIRSRPPRRRRRR